VLERIYPIEGAVKASGVAVAPERQMVYLINKAKGQADQSGDRISKILPI